MYYLKYIRIWICVALLLLSSVMLGFGQAEKAGTLVGHWTFEKGLNWKI